MTKSLCQKALDLCQWHYANISLRRFWDHSEYIDRHIRPAGGLFFTRIWPTSSGFCIPIDCYGYSKPVWSEQKPLDTGPKNAFVQHVLRIKGMVCLCWNSYVFHYEDLEWYHKIGIKLQSNGWKCNSFRSLSHGSKGVLKVSGWSAFLLHPHHPAKT